MTPDRLSYLSQRAFYGFLTLSEQREVMLFVKELCIAAICLPEEITEEHYAIQALLEVVDMPEPRKRCEACGGCGEVRTGGCAIYSCDVCNGSGFINQLAQAAAGEE